MADQRTDQARAVSRALAEPTVHVQSSWIAGLGLASLGMWMAAYTLPQARDRAKDLGVINIAIVCPAAIGALIAAPLVSLGGYPTLFAGTAVVGLLGSILVWRIKSVP
jgi:predicted MFS family arabinose efflux permease